MEQQDKSKTTYSECHQNLTKKQKDTVDVTSPTTTAGVSTAGTIKPQHIADLAVAVNTQSDVQNKTGDRRSMMDKPSELDSFASINAKEESSTNTTQIKENKTDITDNKSTDSPDDSEKVISDDNSPKKSDTKRRLRRTSSSLPLRLVSLPKVNCQERLILCIDHSDELFCNKLYSHSSNTHPVFVTLISSIRQFVNTKSYLNKSNQFSLILLNDGAQFITDLNRNPEELMTMLNDIASMPISCDNIQTDVDKIFDMSPMFDMILEHSGLRDSPKQFVRTAPPFTVRVIFVYGRSDTRLVFSSQCESFNTLIKYPQFFLDCVYIHKPVHDTGNSSVESIFASICNLDVGGTSHIHEVSTDSNKAYLFNVFAKLLAHPLQRPKQNENQIEYELKRDTSEMN